MKITRQICNHDICTGFLIQNVLNSLENVRTHRVCRVQLFPGLHPEGRDLTYLKDGNDRKRVDKGTRIDKFLVTEDLLIKEVTFFHIRYYFYTIEYGMQDNAFDHGAVRMVYNLTKTPTGPGQFKIDPFLIKTGALDFIIKQTIYEANLFTTEDNNLMKIYEDRNKIVVPLLQRIADIEKDRKSENNPGLY